MPRAHSFAQDGQQRKLEYREDRASYEMRFTRREGGDRK